MNWLVSAIGLFYCAAGVIAMRAVLQGVIIDSALSALSPPSTPAKPPTPQWGNIWLLDGSFLVGLAGISALIQWDWSPWVFALAALWQALYLAYVAPKWVDGPGPLDEDAAAGRKQTRNAFLIFMLATIVVAYVYEQGLLTATDSLVWEQLALGITAAVTALVFYGHKTWQLKAFLLGTPLVSSGADDEPIRPNRVLPKTIQVRINQNLGFFFDQETGQPIEDAFETLDLPMSVEDLFDDWMVHWVNHMDPTDPQRLRLQNEADWPIVQACAQRAFDALIAHVKKTEQETNPAVPLKASQFELLAAGVPIEPRVYPNAIALQARFDRWPLSVDQPATQRGAEPETFSPDELGLSWGLSRHIEEWSSEFEDSSDYNFPNVKTKLSLAQLQTFNRAGEELARRIRSELDATNRSQVTVRYMPVE